MKLTKEELILNIDKFDRDIESPLGILFKTGINILNKELQELNFDMSSFMREHADILIEKFRPYPDIIYRLTKDELIFQFALKTKDTATDPSFNFYGVNENNLGCCYNPDDNFCYKNSIKEDCVSKLGIYESAGSCKCDQKKILPKFSLNPVKSCKVTYSRSDGKLEKKEKQNGESWCSFDSENNYDIIDNESSAAYNSVSATVGSRHYVHYCIDGKEFVEPCRDFREEICVEKKTATKDITTAKCRPNRWQDCMDCNNLYNADDKNNEDAQDCCEDFSVRDCAWINFETEKMCVPAVSPGFKFWELSPVTMCSRANQKKECNGLSCSQEWVDASAKLCFMQGDCGNYRNINNVMTRYGFFETDIKYNPDDEIYNIN
ncbi:MAG: hypothetical protein ABIG89_03545, partial [Candidatus Woesearchaeota archaeon]